MTASSYPRATCMLAGVASAMLAGCALPAEKLTDGVEGKVEAAVEAAVRAAALDVSKTISTAIESKAGRDNKQIVNELDGVKSQQRSSMVITLASIGAALAMIAIVLRYLVVVQRTQKKVGYTPENWVRKEKIRDAIVEQATETKGGSR